MGGGIILALLVYFAMSITQTPTNLDLFYPCGFLNTPMAAVRAIGGGGGGRSPPPNAIAYGSGYIPMKGMIKAGFWLNVVGIGLLALLLTAIAHIFVR
ncbi:hypothetical protein HBZC1_04030 [Helicobacter bizzozeronii CIII-1]|uniref:Uncharacterized protein n=1 Tax=Helicobacter bizzozeronii (strain CIII-1) TaxID=1002804 RepID=F8KRK2_HELBC|nr:hypothetical protein HBZC1_04030 [Helicobacter bizzozeronii CIII-1]